MTIRIGSGMDVHAFVSEDDQQGIVLGGVTIPYRRSLLAHSDGDVLCHALMDALLGAAALGDIGQHFPDSEEKWMNADSRVLLRAVQKKLSEAGYQVINVDNTIIAQTPKMAPHIPAMRACLADDLQLTLDAVSVKATTTEQLGFTGREEGIAVQSVVLIESQS